VANNRSVLFVVTDGEASDGGSDGGALRTESDLLANMGVDVYAIGVGDGLFRQVAVQPNFCACRTVACIARRIGAFCWYLSSEFNLIVRIYCTRATT
jgi:hypothetical protein